MRIKLINYNKDFMTSLFTALANSTYINPYTKLKVILNTTDADTLDLMYLTHSGMKYVSPFLKMLMLPDVAPDKAARMKSITEAILIKFGENWERIINAFNSNYNPIENYNMDEHEEVNSNIHNESKSKRYGFNTAADTPVGDNDIESDTSGSKDDNYRDLNRSGNIGVTTSQQMIESELDLRKNYILDIIFNDIDKLLCLKIY